MITFPQNHYRAPHVAVHEVNLEVGVSHFTPIAALDWAPYWPVRFWKIDPVKPGVW